MYYNKLHHDPLSHEEARKCSYELVSKINDVIKQLHSVGFSHGDLRLPNICFNENYDPVLIDLDFSAPLDSIISSNQDMESFACDLICCFNRSRETQNDSFHFKSNLLQSSILSTGKDSVQSTILAQYDT